MPLPRSGNFTASTDAAALAGARDIGSTTNDPRQSATSYSAVAGNRRSLQSQRHHGERLSLAEVLHQHWRDMRVRKIRGTVRQRHPGEAAGERADILWQSDRRQFAEHRGDGHRGAKGGKATPMDVMIILDTTSSMNNGDFELQRRNKNCVRIGRRPGHVERVLGRRKTRSACWRFRA